tara:strand:+ start:709 stop:1350 length:642 start_codon:yes stop_codon:yes gene_type:complete
MGLTKKLQRESASKIVVPKERVNLQGLNNGDMRLTKDSTGLKLNVKYNNKLYETLLRSRQDGIENKYRDSSLFSIHHKALDSSVTKNVWLGMDMDSGKSTGITTLKFGSKYFSNAAKLRKLSWIADVVGAGIWGFKIRRYRKTGSVSSALNYVDVWISETNFTPVQGKVNHVNIDLNVKADDILAFYFKVPIITGATWIGMNYEFQNKINKMR